MKNFTQKNIEDWLEEFLEEAPLTCSNAERFNIMCKAMRNMARVHQEFTEEDAKAWVASMDPPGRWTMEQTSIVMRQHGYKHRPSEFYAVMNSLQSDYGETMAKNGADKIEIWAALAHDWLDDRDAEEGKAGRYYRDIVRH